MMPIIRTTAYTIFLLILTAAPCLAFAIIGDATQVTMSSSANRPYNFAGGEFTLTTDLDEKYASFCVEWEEHISFNTPYGIDSVENYANRGGGPDNGATMVKGEYRDELMLETKWLMNEYINGGLKQKYASVTNTDLGGAMQVAIWKLEEEDYSAGYEFLYGNTADSLIADANRYFQMQNLIYPDQFSNVKVVNLIFENSDHVSKIQSQIIAAPVPEPATMLLFGTGLISLASLARKKSKR